MLKMLQKNNTFCPIVASFLDLNMKIMLVMMQTRNRGMRKIRNIEIKMSSPCNHRSKIAAVIISIGIDFNTVRIDTFNVFTI